MDLYQKLSDHFQEWEMRGRGTSLHPAPVHLEPPYVPFAGNRLELTGPGGQGSRQTLLSRLTEAVFQTFQMPLHAVPSPAPEPADPQPQPWEEQSMGNDHEIRLLLPPELKIASESLAGCLFAVSEASAPITFELVGKEGCIEMQLAVHDRDAAHVATQVKGHFPEIMVQPVGHRLRDAWGENGDGSERVMVEFGLSRPFMLPLADIGKADPFVGLTGVLSTLTGGEAGIYQVSFLPTEAAWGDNAIQSLSKADGSPVFDLTKEQVKAAKNKMTLPLYAVAVRLAAKAANLERSWEIVRRMAASLRLHSSHHGNTLQPLPNVSYDEEEHCQDLLHRRYRRCGMILNLAELSGFIRFPGPEVRTPGFARINPDTRALTDSTTSPGGVCLGLNKHADTAREVWVSAEQRMRHTHIIGASGSGKTNLMLHMIRQDLDAGSGFALLDPHGDLVDRVMEIIPQSRIQDVVLVDPSDENFIVPFNFLSAHSDFEKTLLASDLVSVFRAQSTSWGDQMNVVFANAIRAFLESSEGGTLSDLRHFLLNPKYRDNFLKTVTDPDVMMYWKLGFPQLGGNKSLGPILTRLETFLSPRPIRYMVSQRENRLDFSAMMDEGKFFLARLPQGQMGKENAHLLGSLLVAKLQQMAMSRQRLEANKRRPFYVYVDEFQNFICPSMAEILSGARKYGMGFILAHQDLRQLDRDKEVASAVLSNAFTRVVFRVSDSDARALSEGFAHFPAHTLQNLRVGHAICRVGQSDNDFNMEVDLALSPNPSTASLSRQAVIESSRRRIAIPRAEVEEALAGLKKADNAKDVFPSESDKLSGATYQQSSTEEFSHNAMASVSEPPSNGASTDLIVNPSNEADKDVGVAEPVKPLRPTKGTAPTFRGGKVHREIQAQLISNARAHGLIADSEVQILDGERFLDAWVGGSIHKVACEVVDSSSLSKEIETMKGCQRCGYQSGLLVCVDTDKLSAAQARFERELPDFNVQCVLPIQLDSYFRALKRQVEASEEKAVKMERVANHDLERRSPKLSAKERQRIEEAALHAIALAIRAQTEPS